MYAATIVPEQFLSRTEGDHFYMALAHLINSGTPYTEFFKSQTQKGIHVLMDNGAAEDSQLDTIFDILDKAELIGATEIVLPDALMDKDVTLARTQKALRELKEADKLDDYLWMAVPQGSDLARWSYCLRNLLELDKDYDHAFNSIGISKFLSLNISPTARIEAVEIALDLLQQYGRTDIDIHLLGCAYDPTEVYYIATKWPGRIRSVDSAIAYVYAQKGLELKSTTARPQFEIEFLAKHEIDEDLLQHNIKVWKGLESVE